MCIKEHNSTKHINLERHLSHTVNKIQNKNLNIKSILQRLIGIVDQQLLVLVAYEVLEAEDVQHADEFLRVGDLDVA